MEKVTLKYLGNGYRGKDEVTGQTVLCAHGMDVMVSRQKADQLLRDYPKNFTDTGQSQKADEPKQEAKVTPPEPAAAEPKAKPKARARAKKGR